MAEQKLLFFDIDGTLWNAKNEIPDSTREAFRRLHENGHQLFICSGRSRGYIYHPDLLGLGFDGIISACGTMIEYHDEVIFHHLIDNTLMEETLATVRRFGFKPILEGSDYLYLEIDEFEGDPYFKKLSHDLGGRIRSIEAYRGAWDVCKFSCDTTDCDTKSCFALLEKDFDFLIHNDRVVEIVPKGFDKGVGIDRVVEYLGADPADTFAFGDSVNDLGMLEKASTGVAMGNGADIVRERADYVTTPMKEDGIYRACEHFHLI